MQRLTIFIFILICSLTYGQQRKDPTKPILRKLKKELSKQGVSDYFVMKRITYGSFHIYDSNDPNSCKAKGTYFTMYAFWENENKAFVKKIDNCSDFNSIELTDSKLFEFYKLNFKKIKEDSVERYKTKPDTIVNGKVYSFTSFQTHSPIIYFWFYKDSDKFNNSFDKYNLTTESDYKNINYESNNNLSIVKLNLLCDEIVNELNEKVLFNRLK